MPQVATATLASPHSDHYERRLFVPDMKINHHTVAPAFDTSNSQNGHAKPYLREAASLQARYSSHLLYFSYRLNGLLVNAPLEGAAAPKYQEVRS
jgi:hypothetical protein